MSIQFESLSPNVIANDVNKTVDYYVQILGFTFITSVPEIGIYNWAMVQHDGVTMMFQSLESIQEDMPALNIQSHGSHGTFYIRMKGLDDYYHQLNGKVELGHDLRTTFYGMKEFTIKDLNGYYLTFAEEVK